jgi:glycopeptide antibiotics resistance protein
MWSRLLVRLLFAVMAIAALVYTPATIGFVTRPALQCELVSSAELWLFGLTNVRHLVTYSILAAVAVWAFGTHSLWLAAAVALTITAGVELTQAIFADGHCRVRDMLPNTVGVAVGVGFALLVALLVRRFFRRRTEAA